MAEPLHNVTSAFDDADEYRPEPEPEPQPAAWCDGSVRIGIHTSIAGDIRGALESAQQARLQRAADFFGQSAHVAAGAVRAFAEADAARFRARRAELGLGPLVIHANYLINLASSDPVMRVRSIQAFHDEMVRAAGPGRGFSGGCIRGRRVAARPAEAMRGRGAGDCGRRRAAFALSDGHFDGLQRGGLRVLIENTAGMGSCARARDSRNCARFSTRRRMCRWEFALTRRTPSRPATTSAPRRACRKTIAALDAAVGLKRVAVVHVNDSKTPFGSRVDRHEHIGTGHDRPRRLSAAS